MVAEAQIRNPTTEARSKGHSLLQIIYRGLRMYSGRTAMAQMGVLATNEHQPPPHQISAIKVGETNTSGAAFIALFFSYLIRPQERC